MFKDRLRLDYSSTASGGGTKSTEKTNSRPPPSFPTSPKRIENPSIDPKGKHIKKKPSPSGQTKLPW